MKAYALYRNDRWFNFIENGFIGIWVNEFTVQCLCQKKESIEYYKSQYPNSKN